MSVKSEKELGPVIRLYDLIEEQVYSREQYLLGRTLTIIDAAISEPEQRKGLKDLVKDIRTDKSWHMYHIGRIIEQFADKYSKVALPEDVRYFLSKGEWKKSASVGPSDQNYFPD